MEGTSEVLKQLGLHCDAASCLPESKSSYWERSTWNGSACEILAPLQSAHKKFAGVVFLPSPIIFMAVLPSPLS